MLQTDRHEKKMRESVFSKNICEGASERQNENIIVSLKTENFNNFTGGLLSRLTFFFF